MPTSGIAGEYVGACETATCTGTFTDNGGAAANYSDNINAIYRVFCPNAAGQCVSLTFNSFGMEGMVDPPGPNPLDCYYDYLLIGNGATQNSAVIDQAPSSAASTTGRICGTLAVPFTYTASNPSGCLTVRMTSDFITTGIGWSATLTCAPCAGGPTGLSNNDCVNATAICANTSVPGNSTGPGIVAEACGGGGCPAGGENYSNWYLITIQTGGTLTFTINPSVAADDYDYSIYGPNTGCGSLGPSIRCSDAGTTGATGLSAAAADVSESVVGDGYTSPLNVLAGQTYYMMIDEWTPTGAGYSLTFGGTAVLGCIMTPVELLDFSAQYNLARHQVDLNWSTATEINNDFFAVERSIDGTTYELIGVVQGSGTTLEKHEYNSADTNPVPGSINYYRLKQVDNNGVFEYSDVQAVIIYDPLSNFHIAPNPAKELATFSYYTNASTEDVFIYVHNSMGQIISTQRYNAQQGTNHYPFELSSLPHGVYFVTLQTSLHTYRSTLIHDF